jgi:hypothetical protein
MLGYTLHGFKLNMSLRGSEVFKRRFSHGAATDCQMGVKLHQENMDEAARDGKSILLLNGLASDRKLSNHNFCRWRSI